MAGRLKMLKKTSFLIGPYFSPFLAPKCNCAFQTLAFSRLYQRSTPLSSRVDIAKGGSGEWLLFEILVAYQESKLFESTQLGELTPSWPVNYNSSW